MVIKMLEKIDMTGGLRMWRELQFKIEGLHDNVAFQEHREGTNPADIRGRKQQEEGLASAKGLCRLMPEEQQGHQRGWSRPGGWFVRERARKVTGMGRDSRAWRS